MCAACGIASHVILLEEPLEEPVEAPIPVAGTAAGTAAGSPGAPATAVKFAALRNRD